MPNNPVSAVFVQVIVVQPWEKYIMIGLLDREGFILSLFSRVPYFVDRKC